MAKYRISNIIREMEEGISKLEETKRKANQNLGSIKEIKNELQKARELYSETLTRLLLSSMNSENYKAYGLFFETVLEQKKYITLPLENFNQKIDESYKTIRDAKITIIEQNELIQKCHEMTRGSSEKMSELEQQKEAMAQKFSSIKAKIENKIKDTEIKDERFDEIQALTKKLNIKIENQEKVDQITKETFSFKFRKSFSFVSEKIKNEISLHDTLIEYEKSNSFLKDSIEVFKATEELKELKKIAKTIEQEQNKIESDYDKINELIQENDASLRKAEKLITSSQLTQQQAQVFLSFKKEDYLFRNFVNNFLEQNKKNPITLFNLDEKIRTVDYSSIVSYQIIEPVLKKAMNQNQYIENINQIKDTIVFEQELSKAYSFNNTTIKKMDDFIEKINKNLRKLKKLSYSQKSQSVKFEMDSFQQSINGTTQNVNNLLGKNSDYISLNDKFRYDYFNRKHLNQNLENDIFLNNYISYMYLNSLDRDMTAKFMGINMASDNIGTIMNSLDNDSIKTMNDNNLFNSLDFSTQLGELCKSDSLTTLMGVEDSFACFDKINDVLSTQNDFTMSDNQFTMPELSNTFNIDISNNTFDSLSSSSFDSSSSSWDSSSSSSSWDSGSSSSSWDSGSSFDSGSSSSYDSSSSW